MCALTCRSNKWTPPYLFSFYFISVVTWSSFFLFFVARIPLRCIRATVGDGDMDVPVLIRRTHPSFARIAERSQAFFEIVSNQRCGDQVLGSVARALIACLTLRGLPLSLFEVAAA